MLRSEKVSEDIFLTYPLSLFKIFHFQIIYQGEECL